MAAKNDLVFKKIAVDIGDLRVEFFGASEFLRSIDIASSPLHLHAKHEFQYIISGTMQAVVNGDRLEDISEDTVLLIPPNMLHSNPSCDGKRLIATLALQQLPGAAGDRSFSEYTYYCELFAAFREPLVFRDAAVTHYIRQILSLQDLPENEHRLKSILTMLFISLADYIKGSAQTEVGQYPFDPGSQYNQQYFLIDNYINRNYNKKVTIQELSDYLHEQFPDAMQCWGQVWGYQVGYDRDGYTVPDRETQLGLYQRHKEIAYMAVDAYGRVLIPCGEAWEFVRQGGYDNLCARLGKGTNNEGDYYHEGDIGGGQYLNACVWFEMITGESCVGNTYVPSYVYNSKTYYVSDDISLETLQAAAHRAVEEYKAIQ